MPTRTRRSAAAPLTVGAVRTARFHALADPTRLAVLDALAGGEQCVCDLQSLLGAAQSRLSFHLRVLREAGLVHDRREGRWSYYRLCPEALAAASAELAALGTRAARALPQARTRCCD